ncbi:MAG: nucleotidyltransferase [Chitinispirillaceae bacterium]|nr:nucleotidyltransferase [Chitinispirillaceae bacterium]
MKEFFRLLNANNVEYVIVGGYAVAFHGFVRATKDIDVLFNATPENIRRLMAALTSFGIAESILHPDDFSDPGRIQRIGNPPMMIELINAIGGVTFEEVWSKRISGRYGDIEVPFLSREHLLISKKYANRPQDQRDIDELTHQ